MNILDISWPLSENMTSYKNKPSFSIEQTKKFEQDNARETRICLSSHAGTHIDAPAHFMSDGQVMDHLDLKTVIGPCKVLDCMHVTDAITETDLQKYELETGDIILLKTKNSLLQPTESFDAHFIYLAESGARFLVEKKIKAVGIDYLGIERNQPDHPTHTLLMNNAITIIEGLRLQHADAGTYFLLCLPLKVVGVEAAPARAILIS